ncbi:MAG TPA: hypothetical protein VIH82_02650 [Acidimicrobiia bacterium]
MPGTTGNEGSSNGTEHVPRWRRILCGVLIVLVCILAPLSLLAVWTHNTLLNTDQYVETVGPLAEDPDIQEALADRVVLALQRNVDVAKEVKDALPAKAAFVAPFIAKGIDQFVHNATLTIVQSDQFESLWENLNRRAHSRVVAVLTGNEGGRVTTKNGEVTIELGPVVEKVQGALSKIGVDIFSGSDSNAPRELVLFKSEELTKVQGAVDLLDTLAYWLPVVMLLMLIVALVISPNRRRTVLRAAIGIAIGMALLLVIFNVARSFYLDAGFRNRDAAGAAYDQVLGFLRLSARSALAVAIVVAIGAWIAGPGRLATRIRDGVKKLSSGGEGQAVEESRVGHFVTRYKTALRAAVVVIALVILVAMSRVSPLTVLVVALVVVLGLVIIEVLGRGAPSPEPEKKAASKRAT